MHVIQKHCKKTIFSDDSMQMFYTWMQIGSVVILTQWPHLVTVLIKNKVSNGFCSCCLCFSEKSIFTQANIQHTNTKWGKYSWNYFWGCFSALFRKTCRHKCGVGVGRCSIPCFCSNPLKVWSKTQAVLMCYASSFLTLGTKRNTYIWRRKNME